MDPIIKWPGGKTRELSIISDYIPEFKRYYEPFFGGGAVGLSLEPDVAFVNDVDTLLIQLYRDIKDLSSQFYTDFPNIMHDWRLIEKLAPDILYEFKNIFPDTLQELEHKVDELDTSNILKKFDHISNTMLEDLKYTLPEETHHYIETSLKSKISRVAKLQLKHSKIFDDELLEDHLMTAIKSGYYTLIRNEYFNPNPVSASFYFIREFCYGSMFRFNSKGEFNIPYGGINYNFKDIESKFEYLKSTKVSSVLNKFEFNNLDFENFFSDFKFSSSDFIFLDPPYDSDFKNYGKNPFTQEDQIRLAEILSECQANWLLVIQKSDLIWDLYSTMEKENSNVSILLYDKKYTYNVRGRNDRDVSHLLIKNF